jgi:integrase
MAIRIWLERSMPPRKKTRAAVKLPKGVHKTTARCHDYYCYQAGRGTASAGPRITLPRDPESPEFWAALREAQGKSSVPIVNTVNLVVDDFLATIKPTLSKSAFSSYTRALNIPKTAWGELSVEGVRPAHVKKLMDGLAKTPSKANQFLSVMGVFSGWAIVSEKITQGLTEGVKPYTVTGGHKPWSDAQVAIALSKFSGELRKGFVLYLYSGQRGQDVVRLGWTFVDDGGFDLGQKKTGVDVWCPIVSELAAEMKNWEKRPGPFLLQPDGRPYTRKKFWEEFTEAIESITELAGVTLHGLRCTAAIRLKLAGLSVPEISGIMGMSMQTITRYCRFADLRIGGKEALIKLEEHRASKAKRAAGNVK